MTQVLLVMIGLLFQRLVFSVSLCVPVHVKTALKKKEIEHKELCKNIKLLFITYITYCTRYYRFRSC
jgi:hypothetical protein